VYGHAAQKAPSGPPPPPSRPPANIWRFRGDEVLAWVAEASQRGGRREFWTWRLHLKSRHRREKLGTGHSLGGQMAPQRFSPRIRLFQRVPAKKLGGARWLGGCHFKTGRARMGAGLRRVDSNGPVRAVSITAVSAMPGSVSEAWVHYPGDARAASQSAPLPTFCRGWSPGVASQPHTYGNPPATRHSRLHCSGRSSPIPAFGPAAGSPLLLPPTSCQVPPGSLRPATGGRTVVGRARATPFSCWTETRFWWRPKIGATSQRISRRKTKLTGTAYRTRKTRVLKKDAAQIRDWMPLLDESNAIHLLLLVLTGLRVGVDLQLRWGTSTRTTVSGLARCVNRCLKAPFGSDPPTAAPV